MKFKTNKIVVQLTIYQFVNIITIFITISTSQVIFEMNSNRFYKFLKLIHWLTTISLKKTQ